MTTGRTFYFKKGRHFEIAFATLMKMFMNTLREILSVDGTSVVPTPVPDGSLRLTNVVMTTRTTRKSVYHITGIACEMVADFESLSRSMESNRCTNIEKFATPAGLTSPNFPIWVISTRLNTTN